MMAAAARSALGPVAGGLLAGVLLASGCQITVSGVDAGATPGPGGSARDLGIVGSVGSSEGTQSNPVAASVTVETMIGANSLKAPVGLAVERTGSVLVADGQFEPRRISSAQQLSSVSLSSLVRAVSERVTQVALDADQRIYYVESEHGVVARAGDDRTRYAFGDPSALAVGGDGSLFVADAQRHRIFRLEAWGQSVALPFAGSGEAGWGDGTASQARFRSPHGLALDASGSVLVADSGNHCIRRIDPSGAVTTLAGGPVAGYQDGEGAQARFYNPTGVAVDRAGNVLVADTGNHCVRWVDPRGRVRTLAGTGAAGFADGPGACARFDGPVGVAIGDDGTVVVADGGNRCVRRIRLGAP